MTPSQATAVRGFMRSLLPRARAEALALTDAWDFTDRELVSAIGACGAMHCGVLAPAAQSTPHAVAGRKDGKVYEALWMWAQQAPMNASVVTPAYKASIEPLVKQVGMLRELPRPKL